MTSEREYFVDIWKGIGMTLVIIGHITSFMPLGTYIQSFHMPLFFFVSGYLFNSNKYLTFKSFINNKFWKLLFPYLFFYIITYLYWVIIEKQFRGNLGGADSEWYKPIIGLIYGSEVNGTMIHNGVLWFIPCLFTTETLFYFIIQKVKTKIGIFFSILSFLIIGKLFILNNLTNFPWGISISFVAIFIYGIGYISKNLVKHLKNIRLNNIFIIILTIILQYIVIPKNVFIVMMNSNYGNILYFIIEAFAGTLLFMSISILINRNSFLEYIGRNSILFLAFHQPIKRGIIYLLSKIIHIPLSEIRENIICTLIALSLTIIIIIPIVYIYNKYFPKLLVYIQK